MTGSTPIRDLLLPASDGAALIQVVTVLAITVIAAILVRRERPVVLLVVGVGTTLLGLMALRTLH